MLEGENERKRDLRSSGVVDRVEAFHLSLLGSPLGRSSDTANSQHHQDESSGE